MHAFKKKVLYSQSAEKAITQEAFNVAMKEAGKSFRLQGDLGDLVDTVGRITRLPGRGLLGTDEFAQHLAYRGQVAANSVRNARDGGPDE